MDFFTTPRTPLFIFSQSELFLILGADECANDWKTCRDNNFGAINPPVNESRASHDLLIFSFGEKQVVQYMYVHFTLGYLVSKKVQNNVLKVSGLNELHFELSNT